MLGNFKKTLSIKGEVYIRVKVRPGAARTAVREIMEGGEGTAVKVDIAAPPVRGRANAELSKFFEQEFSVPKGSVKILSGAAEKIKLIKISKK